MLKFLIQNVILSLFFAFNIEATSIAIIADSIGVGIKGEIPFPIHLENFYGDSVKIIKNCRGSTCVASNLSRLEGILERDIPDYLICTLGINDALSVKTPIKELYKDWSRTIKLAQENGIIVLIGYIDATSYDSIIKNREYELEFENLYNQLRDEFGVILFPFLFKEFIEQKVLTYDKFHPTEIGQKVIANIIKKTLDPFIIR